MRLRKCANVALLFLQKGLTNQCITPSVVWAIEAGMEMCEAGPLLRDMACTLGLGCDDPSQKKCINGSGLGSLSNSLASLPRSGR